MATISQMANISYGSGISSTSSSSESSTILKDYYSIKNGSYKKLLKAYYSENEAASSILTSSDSTSTIANIQEDASGLKSCAEALVARGSKNLFDKKEITTTDENGNKTTTTGYDVNSIYDAAKDFVDNYNSLMESSLDAESTSVLKKTVSLVNLTKSNSKSLAEIGITVGSNNKLTINETQFKESEMSAVKSLFNGTGSYMYNVSAKASNILTAANKESFKSNTYTDISQYSYNYSQGNIFADYF